MDIWQYVPEREKRRIAHFHSWFMKASGRREKNLELVRALRGCKKDNELLRGQREELKKSMDREVNRRISEGIENYVATARMQVAEYKEATKELVASAMTRNMPDMSDRLKMSYVPQRSVVPIVINSLALADRNFRKAPLTVWHDGERIHTGENFYRVCKLGTIELGRLVEDSLPELVALRKGETYVIEREGFDLALTNVSFGESLQSVGVYAVPKKLKAGKIMSDLGASAIDRIQRFCEKYRPAENGGDLGYATA